MEKYERDFNHFDSNGDGKICPEELRQCVGSISGGCGGADGFGRGRAAVFGGFREDSGGSGRGRETERFEGGLQTVRTGVKRVHYTRELEENAIQIGVEKKCSRLQEYDRTFCRDNALYADRFSSPKNSSNERFAEIRGYGLWS
ncbi:uncharacterized protein LOC131021157 [Salvia miltiorrhiza]|uniref:uncharacterized protein LOC131021157 n=1 Tax=Salvia miltiorrhiza TaxID=226208 RepID=UPI0025AC4D95|nr:uncharacterized protein LOC131021157 [Salvia miltiorrhiza]